MGTDSLLNMAISAIPLLMVAGALANMSTPRWRLGQLLAGLAFVISTATLVAWFAGLNSQPGLQNDNWFSHSGPNLIMLTLVSFIGTINLLYSRQYMAGDRTKEAYYARWLMMTLGAVTLVASTNHMLVLLLGWTAISLSLHQLLMFFPDRPRAALATHKKFIFARIAEASLLGAILLLEHTHQTWNIHEIAQYYLSNNRPLSVMEQTAGLLIALTALIKCAQLPWHGWLIQVVEAPTPVSALLHAGIINLGGFLIIQFAPLIMQSNASQWLLLIVGGLTTVMAALVMMTRASIKVKLAWSTMSQMGLMLVECALGLFELALLHLIAHSCYKAYAFLDSGSEVESTLQQQMSQVEKPGLGQWLGAALIAGTLVSATVIMLEFNAPYSPWMLLAIAMTLFIAERNSRQIQQGIMAAAAFATLLIGAYTLQKQGLGLAISHMQPSVGQSGDIWMASLFALFAAAYLALRYQAHKPYSQRLTVALYAGFYLDEWVTRMTLKIWPTQLPVRSQPKSLGIGQEEIIK